MKTAELKKPTCRSALPGAMGRPVRPDILVGASTNPLRSSWLSVLCLDLGPAGALGGGDLGAGFGGELRPGRTPTFAAGDSSCRHGVAVQSGDCLGYTAKLGLDAISLRLKPIPLT